MIASFRHLDRLLRGEATQLDQLRDGRLELPAVGLSFVLVVLGMLYGLCMGTFSLTASGSGAQMQIVATAFKVPALFVATLIVTFPSLYVFNALFGSRLSLPTMLKLMVGALAVLMAVLASIGPIVAFFSVSSTSYAFMVILNVVVFALAGFLGLGFLLQTLHRLTLSEAPEPIVPSLPPPVPEEGDSTLPEPTWQSAVARPDKRKVSAGVWLIFRTWFLVFGLVGAQMAWVLRPFIGSPNKPFEWFRPRGGNFFEAVLTQMEKLLGA